jgi:glyoxylase-like metal-dependent hydrolase (beta-lactamase superfamily II)
MSTASSPSPPGLWEEITPGVWVAVAEPETVNLGLVVGRDACLLVDTGSSPEQGALIRASISSVTRLPLVAVVVTHWHFDHAFGLAAFDDVDTIAHESVAPRLVEAGVVPPRRTLAVATAVDLGERRVEIVHLGRGHTDGDLVVVVPDADLVFAGDLIESAGPPQYDDDSFGAEWATTLDGLVGLMTSATRAVPGHGEPVDRTFVFAARGQAAARAAELSGQAPRSLPLV